ncbi:HNH endonuclease [Thermogemmatispora sp.]|uniref:HNH endonuclease n=1 Tax=Thermogemmatispora sp. TaxID=1968838 RepID=UPI0035E3F620
MPLELEHSLPQSRGGIDRVSNLTVACRACDQARGNRTAKEDGHPEGQAGAKVPPKEATAVNTTRRLIRNGLLTLGRAVRSWTGGRTKGNRERFGLPKTQALDALCVGDLAGVFGWQAPLLESRALGRGQRCRTNVDTHGFPRGSRMRSKTVRGCRTGCHTGGSGACGSSNGQAHRRPEWPCGRARLWILSSRTSGSDGISWRWCRLLQRADGYGYGYTTKGRRGAFSPGGNAVTSGAT